MTGNDAPKRYRIEALLATAVQPFQDLDTETLAALGVSLGRQGVRMLPVVTTEEGTVIDGIQRLRALVATGAKTIRADQVVALRGVHDRDALEWAVRLNAQRRHLTTETKADAVRRLKADGWSQARAAEAFGVSPAAVSGWLREYPGDGDGDDDGPDVVEAADGRLIDVRGIREAQRERHAREAEPRALEQLKRDVRRVTTRLANFHPVGLDAVARVHLREAAGRLREAVEDLVARLDDDAEVEGDDDA